MEDCGRGAAVEQLTARGMVSIPTMGAIENANSKILFHNISIPAMGGNSTHMGRRYPCSRINPRDGGQ